MWKLIVENWKLESQWMELNWIEISLNENVYVMTRLELWHISWCDVLFWFFFLSLIRYCVFTSHKTWHNNACLVIVKRRGGFTKMLLLSRWNDLNDAGMTWMTLHNKQLKTCGFHWPLKSLWHSQEFSIEIKIVLSLLAWFEFF